MISISSCISSEKEENINDVLLAKVYNKPLYLSELDGMIPRTATPADSSLIVSAFIERWVRENLMLYEAERNVPKDLNIDKLVRDYRASLILHNYEEMLIESDLDSMISEQEILNYFNEHKTHFQLETNIMRCNFMKLDKNAPQMDKVEEWWEADSFPQLKYLTQYCDKNAIVYQLEDSIWLDVDQVEAEFPKGALSSMKEGKEFKLTEGDYKYFIRIMEIQSKNSDPPVGYIKAHATKYILHNRKLKLIEDKKEQLYQKSDRKGHIKIY